MPIVIRNFQTMVKHALPSKTQFTKFIYEAFFNITEEDIQQHYEQSKKKSGETESKK